MQNTTPSDPQEGNWQEEWPSKPADVLDSSGPVLVGQDSSALEQGPSPRSAAQRALHLVPRRVPNVHSLRVPRIRPDTALRPAGQGVAIESVAAYVAALLSRLRAVPHEHPAGSREPEALAGEIFSILTDREFSCLSRARTARYRDTVTGMLAENIRAGEPLRFYYDLGAGYHASIRPDEPGLVFDVGFAELCVLAQIASFCRRVAERYPHGAAFTLVIDNVCGLMTNDVPIERTAAYCAILRRLVAETGMADRVSLLVESEEFALDEYEIDRARLAADTGALRPTRKDVENVRRFLGRRCDDAEAVDRIARYRQAAEITERRLAEVVRGVRMTQRATGSTLGFRPFPGGDSRTQVGEVALGPNAKGTLRPLLLTSRNIGRYRCTQVRDTELLPAAVPHVTYAEPLENLRPQRQK